MLAVRKDYRNVGLGRRIKLFQRGDALERGFELIEWTYDPLEIKNSYLNIERLGAISRRYNVNQYGITSSPLQGGLPTDRLIAEWWLKSKRVQGLLASGTNRPSETQGLGAGSGLRMEGVTGDQGSRERNSGPQPRGISEGILSGPRRARIRARPGRQRHVSSWAMGRGLGGYSWLSLPVHGGGPYWGCGNLK